MTVNINTARIRERVEKAAMVAIIRGTEQVRNTAVNMVVSPPKTGRIYRRRGVSHQASAPGEAPATDTGNLVRLITTSYDFKNLIGRVTASAEYARALEYGTPRMAPRPFMRPALELNRKAITEDIDREVAKALSK